ncbi:hypothetical protein TanjilG_08267, partial [Lupinus angustifolius]
EDTLLVQSYINISLDEVVRDDQKSDCFWYQIHDNYNEHRDKNTTKEIQAR